MFYQVGYLLMSAAEDHLRPSDLLVDWPSPWPRPKKRTDWSHWKTDWVVLSLISISYIYIYPLVMTNIAIENHHFQWVNPLF